MSASNKGPNVDSRLQNLTNALYLDGNDDVVVRTGFVGNIVISGNVNVPGVVSVDSSPDNPVHVHLTELGTFGNLTTFVPVRGNVTVDNFPTNVRITDGSVTVSNFPSNVRITDMPGITGRVTVDQGTSPWVVTGNVTATVSGNVTIPTDITLADSDYYFNVARGLMTGQIAVMKNGYAGSINQDTETTIWGQTTLYPWSSFTTAQKLHIISTSASDTGQTLRITGLDSNYNQIIEDVTTNGGTAVATTNNFLRINHCYLIAGNTNVGVITERLTSGTGTVVGSMAIGFGRNKGGFYTVPAGYTAYIMYGDATQFRGGAGNIGGVIKMYTRTPNGGTSPFILQFMAEVVNGQYRNDFTVPLAVPEKTDIDVRIVADGNGTQATCNWQMILIPN